MWWSTRTGPSLFRLASNWGSLASLSMASSLDSLANGWRDVGGEEVLGSYAGILAPPHDGDLFAFTGNVRVAFDEAEPMEVQSEASDRSESEVVVEFNL